ncbi:MAG: hypothetical protein M1546_01835 [Chloroflexi bacterium]|nr:hypothetical protein [Chloroflexota bacterium]
MDLAIVAPALIVSGVLLLRRAPIGYLLASTMLVYTVVLIILFRNIVDSATVRPPALRAARS